MPCAARMPIRGLAFLNRVRNCTPPQRVRTPVKCPAWCTIERSHLSLHTFMKRFTRLVLGFSKKFDNLEAAINPHLAYYNFCWRLGKLRITPAMAAGAVETFLEIRYPDER